MLFKLRVLVKIVLTLVLLDHKLSYLQVLQCSHHSSSFFTIVFISFSPGDPLALGPLPLGYPNGKYNNNNNLTFEDVLFKMSYAVDTLPTYLDYLKTKDDTHLDISTWPRASRSV